MPWGGLHRSGHSTIWWWCHTPLYKKFYPHWYHDRVLTLSDFYVRGLLVLYPSLTRLSRSKDLRKIGEEDFLKMNIREIVIPMNPKNTLRPLWGPNGLCEGSRMCESVCPWRVFPVPLLHKEMVGEKVYASSLVVTGVPWYDVSSHEDYWWSKNNNRVTISWSRPKKKKIKSDRERVVHNTHRNHWRLRRWPLLPLAPPMTRPCVFPFDTLPRRILGDAGCAWCCRKWVWKGWDWVVCDRGRGIW
jgi:hypothetical protein